MSSNAYSGLSKHDMLDLGGQKYLNLRHQSDSLQVLWLQTRYPRGQADAHCDVFVEAFSSITWF